MIRIKIDIILKELKSAFLNIDNNPIDDLISLIKQSHIIVIVGAGRMGYCAKAFAMRLNHLGFNAFYIEDSNVPQIGKSDLLIALSGSGETQTIYNLVRTAKLNKASVVHFTSNKNSRIGKLATLIIEIQSPNKTKLTKHNSVQPMTTLTEQSAFIFFDALVLLIMEKFNITNNDMIKRHSILE